MSDPEYGADTFEGDSASLSEICELAARQALSDFFAVVPGVVVSYDDARGTATIQPAVQQVGGDGAAYPLQPVPDVRVLYMGTAGADIVLELVEGDTGLLLVSSLCMDQWIEGGDASAKPTSTRRGDMADGVFLPCRLTKPQVHTVGGSGVKTRVLIDTDGNVEITAGGTTKAVALAPDLATYLGTTLKAWLDTPVVAPPGGGPCTHPSGPAPSPPNFASTKVKAE